ncbi:hypothetical protein VHA01S_068_00150 [Vibrio halioticoli NBRC 102217]|uniref:Protein nucleotidyltransferase YdiU n=1 Tax=Vibrio halioticoli NBRC 102217 TaxID=1219072 RepID=V5FQZ4_9VIBR|nr:YdiU family protein [Vibrio halioticoli]GAD91107.1 hypothetical protein VHA01S_068_00150 [Vibrio halioticoli NBRC 102217]
MKSLAQLEYLHDHPYSYAKLGASLSTPVMPEPLTHPYLIHINQSLAKRLGVDLLNTEQELLTSLLAGSEVLPNWQPLAMKYTGHQFGQYNPDLGDGRGLLLAEFIAPNSADLDSKKWDFHLKGSGQTPYSRNGDGRAVIRSTVREYLISAAMQGLRIPTTQALAMLGSTTLVQREETECAATLLRVAPSHIRFGHFEYLFYSGQDQQLKLLAEHVMHWHMPEIDLNAPDKYEQFFAQVVSRTANTIAQWHAYGFCHGVMNTDNMSILGLTFDYGPFAFLDTYQPNYICNHSDYSGRYAFDEQPGIGQWNLSALGYALSKLIDTDAIETALHRYSSIVQSEYRRLMRARFGLISEQDGDPELINECLFLMEKLELDYHYTLRCLSEIDCRNWHSDLAHDINNAEFSEWLTRYQARLSVDYIHDHDNKDKQRQQAMQAVNPKYLLRTHLAQEAITLVENGQYDVIEQWLKVLENPFIAHDCPPHWSQPPSNEQKGHCLSCSS